MGKFKKILVKFFVTVRLLWYSLFYGMESANKMLFNQDGDVTNNGIHQNLSKGGVMNDLLEQKVTKEVEELREKHYRIIKEADKYDPSTIQMSFDKDGNPIFSNTGHILKKTYADFMKHPPVYNDNDVPIRVIQDNKTFQKKNSILNHDENPTDDLYVPLGIYDYDTTLTIIRGMYTPRILIDKFVTKMVVRQYMGEKRALVDFYLPTTASQFGKIDAILVSNLYSMFENKNYRSDLTDFDGIEWYSDKAWNSDDMCLFKYDDVKLIDINVFDGSFVLTFDCNIVSDGASIVEKYMTKEMDEKYEHMEPKSNAVDMFASQRRADKLEKKHDEIILKNNTIIKL